MVFQFEHVGLDHADGKFRPRPLVPGELAASLTEWQEALAAIGWNSLYLSNHDQPRPVSRFGDPGEWWRESATALATVLHLQRGTPYVYQGEELGMTNAPFDRIDEYRDVESLNYFASAVARGEEPAEVMTGLLAMSRDHARTPVQWDASENAGFTTGEPWIAVNPNHVTINAAAQSDLPGSVFNHYRALIDLRHRLPVVADGDFTRIDAGDPAVFAFERSLGDQRLFVIANLSSAPMVATLPGRLIEDWRGLSPVLANLPEWRAVDAALDPWEAKVYLR
jgi:oligo-1,6-glucosidase